jgi:caspase domain-containing protein/uncharacterized protein DUF4384
VPGSLRKAILCVGLLSAAARVFLGTAAAADHALIMTISDYEGAPALPGVKMDAANAAKLLKGIGFSNDDVRVIDGSRLTLSGMRLALTQLAHDTKDGDRIFVYFSGHGTSYSVGDRCEQALVSRDMKPFAAHDLFQYLAALRDRTSRVVVVLDSCFSGGVAQTAADPSRVARSIGSMTPKYWKRAGDSASCSTPINLSAAEVLGLRSLKGAVNLERNYVYVAAARDNEVAFDDGAKGGVATTALVDCVQSSVPDSDHSGSISFGELASCAQARINQRSPTNDTLRQHLVVTGNDGLPVMAAADTPATASTNPSATLRDVLQAADARWDVQATASATALRIGKDAFGVSVTSSRSGYLYIVYVGSDQREFLKLYPTAASEPNLIHAGEPFDVPKRWHSEGPPGTDHLLVLVASQPRDLQAVFGQRLAVPATYTASAGLHDSLGVCRNFSSQACPGAKSRNLSSSDSAPSDAASYGAAMLAIDERTE